MKPTIAKWATGVALALVFAAYGLAAPGQGNGKAKGHDKHDKKDKKNEDRFYRDHEQQEIRGWYDTRRNDLPPGLAKRDRLPPGLEKQLVRRGTLPPGLQKKIQPCPEELRRRLPPPPPDCDNVLIGGHVVLLNRRTQLVVDIFHFEIN